MDYHHIKIDKWPCCVIASPRTGSSAFAYDLVLRNNLTWKECLFEPNLSNHSWEPIQTKLKNNDLRFVVKFMIDEAHQHANYRQLLEMPTYNIRLYRRNKVNQIASRVISQSIQKWYFTSDEKSQHYDCQWNIDMLDECIKELIYKDIMLRDSHIRFDETVAYEDLYLLDTSWLVKTQQPGNYQDVCDAVKERLISKNIPLTFDIVS
jgi:hypothetical protein